jgi:RNA polymerase sigma-70 factor (ECF subfamily)
MVLSPPLRDGSSVTHATGADPVELAAACAGDQDAFRELTDRYVRELHVHCYRMLGSFHDAEDAVQETLLRAWRHLATFEGRSSFRGWLYRIATNVCLTRGRRQRVDVRSLPLPLALADDVARGTEPEITLSPYPDTLLDELPATSGDPAVRYDLYESVQLAFLAAIQLLPARQRAVFVLRDVLSFSADEVASMLDATTASVNGALHRARATIERQRAAGRLQRARIAPSSEGERSLLQRYVEAWEATDVDALAGLLKRDAVLTMPPLPVRYTGRKAVARFFATVPAGGRLDRFRYVPTRANRQPALGVYRRDADGSAFRAWGVWVFSLDADAIAEITAFVDATLPSIFGLPAEVL